MPNQVAIDLSGKRFGRLVVLERATVGKGHKPWVAACDCGTVTHVDGRSLRRGATRSCGCLRKEVAASALRSVSVKHGGCGTPTYICWRSMHARCYGVNTVGYQDYGGRGIKVCERWHDYPNFLADMGERPDGMTIERIDNQGNYEPGNCRWATQAEQNRNRRTTRYIEFAGKRQCLAEWARDVGLSGQTLAHRLKQGWPIEAALTTPAGGMHGRP